MDEIRRREWPGYVAVAGLAVFAIALPFMAFVQFVGHASWFGEQQSPDALTAQFAWAVTGLASGLLSLGCAGVALVAGRRAGRVVGGVTVVLGLLATGLFGLATYSTAPRLPVTVTVAAPEVPECGPDSRPPVYGGDSRYLPCDDERRIAERLAATISPALPTENVTTSSVEAVALELESDGRVPAGFYEGSYGYPNGDVVAGWSTAPVTCILALWADETGSWEVRVTGKTIDGGCVYIAQ